MEVVVTLSVEKTWIRTVLDEQIDDLHESVLPSSLRQRSVQISTDVAWGRKRFRDTLHIPSYGIGLTILQA
jgi:hypothetical protein